MRITHRLTRSEVRGMIAFDIRIDGMDETMADEESWPITRARARFRDVVKQAEMTPQTITKYGRPYAVVVSARVWQRKSERRGSLAEFLMASPLRGADLDIDRLAELPKDTLF